MSHPEDYAGHDVRLVVHAHVMATSVDEALRLAVEGLRKQTRVQLTNIVPVGTVDTVNDNSNQDNSNQEPEPGEVPGCYVSVDTRRELSTTKPTKPTKRKRKGAHRPLLCENHSIMLDWDEGCSSGFVGCARAQQENNQ